MAGEQAKDEFCSNIITHLTEPLENTHSKRVNQQRLQQLSKFHFDTETNILHRILAKHGHTKYVPVIPKSLQERMLALFHNTSVAGHASRDKATANLTKRCWWRGCGKDMARWVKACLACRTRKAKSLHKNVGKLEHIVVQKPWDVVSMDCVGPMPATTGSKNTYIITMIDHMTSYPHAKAVRSKPTAQMCADALFDQVIQHYGVPRILLTDRGSEFTAALFNHLCKRMNLKHVTTTAYNPQCNGKNEKIHLFLQTAMFAFIDKKHKNWDRYLPAALLAYRTSPLAGIGYSPAYLCHGFEPNLPFDIIYGAKTLIKDDILRMGTRFSDEIRTAFDIVNNLRKQNNKKVKRQIRQPENTQSTL
jgi:transposase InsO family protein